METIFIKYKNKIEPLQKYYIWKLDKKSSNASEKIIVHRTCQIHTLKIISL